MVKKRAGPVLCTIMKRTFLALSIGLIGAMAQAQTAVTVSTSPQNADQVWYSMANGEVGRAPLAEWDLAFEMTGFEASIRVNTAKGLQVFETPNAIGDWDNVNTVDTANWTAIYNADSNWSVGALSHGNNLDLPEGFNVGWGNYSVQTHATTGTKIYAILLADGTTWMKLRINYLANNVYSFTYANLDGSDEHQGSVNKVNFTGKNFGYWSFATDATLDREPMTADWDLEFTKYTGFVPTAYPIAGVLQNKEVTALQVDDVPTSEAQWTSASFSANANVLGADWKSYSFADNAFHIVGDTTYFVKDIPGNIWKIVFTGYGGSANGDMSFNQEMVSAVGIGETDAHQGSLTTWPNPVTGGVAELILDVPAHEGTLRVFSTTGQEMVQQRWSGLSGLTARTLDVGGLAKGLYIVRFDAANSSTTGKLVVE